MKSLISDFLKIFIPLILLVSGGALFYLEQHRAVHTAKLAGDERIATEIGAGVLARHFAFVARDIDFLVGMPALEAVLEGRKDANELLAPHFVNFARAHPFYQQVRWLDETGRERLRVDRDDSGAIRLIPRDALQNKGDRYYFVETMRGAAGEIFTSPIDLNIENGMVETPHRPMLRVAMPLFNKKGERRGIVVVNYSVQVAIDRMRVFIERPDRQSYLVNSEGYWLHSPDPADSWGFMFRAPARTMARRFPTSWSSMTSSSGQFMDEHGLWSYQRLVLADIDPQLKAMNAPDPAFGVGEWLVVSYVAKDDLDRAVSRAIAEKSLALVAFGLFVLVCAVSILLAYLRGRERLVQERFRALVDSANIGIGLFSDKTGWHATNPHFEKLLGRPHGSGGTVTNAANCDATLNLLIERCRHSTATLVERVVLQGAQGQTFDAMVSCAKVNDETPSLHEQNLSFVVTVDDISSVKATERLLALEARRANMLLALPTAAESQDEADFLQFGIECVEQLTNSRIGFIHFVNDDGESIELVTWSRNTLATYCRAVHDTHYPLSQAGIWADAARRREPVVINDYASATGKGGLPTGHAELIRLISIPVIEHETVRMMLGVGNKETEYDATDVETARLFGDAMWRIVQRLRTKKSLEMAMTVVNNSPVVSFRWLPVEGWPVSYVSDNVRLWGYEPEALMAGVPAFASIVHPDDLTRIGNEVQQLTAAGASFYEQMYRIIKADGQCIWVNDRTYVRRTASGSVECYEGVLTDITPLKEKEAAIEEALAESRRLNSRLTEANNQLLQSEKMASIGQLAAGIAHELNNPIGFVHSNLGTLDNYLKDLLMLLDTYEASLQPGVDAGMARVAIGKMREDIDFAYVREDLFNLVAESKEGLSRVRKIVIDLKNFSRVGEQHWELADIHQGLDSTLNIIWNELKYKCKIEKDYGDIPPVYCLIAQLNQVFMNILVNAGHAIASEGTITIRTRRHGEDEVQIEICDTGTGISPENMARIFDPFFTTKAVGKGTGLGLSISYSIMQAHHGRIEVESELGKGTCFRLILPLQQAIQNDLNSSTRR